MIQGDHGARNGTGVGVESRLCRSPVEVHKQGRETKLVEFLLDASGLLPRVAVKDGAPDTTCSCYIAIPAVILQQNNGLV